MSLDATGKDFAELNRGIRESTGDCRISHCLGQRFIAAGMGCRRITIDGTPGNALGAYLAGAVIEVNGNAQDAVGDTMNDGELIIHGNIGDAAGYAMRGGAIYIKGNAGYRAGVHMKEYRNKKPVIVIGGRAGSFLGEYQAGGLMIVLGMNGDGKPIVGDFPCTGMYGGKLILRGNAAGIPFPRQVGARAATDGDRSEFAPYLQRFCDCFGYDAERLLREPYTVVEADKNNRYKQMYVVN